MSSRNPLNIVYDTFSGTNRNTTRTLLLWIISAGLAFVMDLVVTIVLGIRIKAGFVLAFPIILIILDAIMIGLGFLINFRMKYSIFIWGAYCVLSIVFGMLSGVMPRISPEYEIISVAGMAFVIITQVLKAVIIAIMSILVRVREINGKSAVVAYILESLMLLVVAAVITINMMFGYMWQGISVTSKQATLVYEYDSAYDTYSIVDTMDDGNYIVIPEEFNGKKVDGISFNALDNKINTIILESDQIQFIDLASVSTLASNIKFYANDIDTINRTRNSLYSAIVSFTQRKILTSEQTVECTKLLNGFTIDNLNANEAVCNFTYTDNSLYNSLGLGYIESKILPIGKNIEVKDISIASSYLGHLNGNSQNDLKYCFDNMNGYMLVVPSATITHGTMNIPVDFNKIFYVTLENDNDDSYNYTKTWDWVGNAQLTCFASNENLSQLYESLPTRQGLTANWVARETTNRLQVFDSINSLKTVMNDFTGHNIYINPRWSVDAPVISSANFGQAAYYVYGDIVEVNVEVYSYIEGHYTLIGPDETKYDPISITGGTTKNLTFAIPGLEVADTGVFVLQGIAYDESKTITSLKSTPMQVDKPIIIQQKEIDFNWLNTSTSEMAGNLSVAKTFDGTEYTFGLTGIENYVISYDHTDLVGTDSISYTINYSSIRHSGTYKIQPKLSADSRRNYVVKDGTLDFVINKANIDVTWENLNFIYNGSFQSPTAWFNDFTSTKVYLTISGAQTNTGHYKASGYMNESNYEYYCDYEINNYEQNYVITRKPISVESWTNYTLTYNGSLQGQTAYSLLNEVNGEEGIILQGITYVGNQKDAGTGYTVEAILPYGSNYCFNTPQTCNFDIQKKSTKLSWSANSFVYNGSNQKPEATAIELVPGDTVEVTTTVEGSHTVVGNYLATASITNTNYVLENTTKTKSYSIIKATYDMSGVSFVNVAYTYDGTEKTIQIIGTLPTGLDGVQVTVNYINNTRTVVGSTGATAFFTVSSNYNSIPSKNATLTINKATYNMSGISLNNATYTYDGTEKTLQITGTLPTGLDGIQVQVAYSSNKLTNAGTIEVTATFTGSENYNAIASKKATLKINAKDISSGNVTLSQTEYIYDGHEKTPNTTVVVNAITLVKDTDYTVTYINNTNVGTATVRITGKGNYSGTKDVTFSIVEE